jgi:hypothetical protein
MNTLQVFAYDNRGNLAHAGPADFAGDPTKAECRAIERRWRRWRAEYLRAHPGDYPLRKRILGHVYVVRTAGGALRQFNL